MSLTDIVLAVVGAIVLAMAAIHGARPFFTARHHRISGSKLVKGPAESEKFVRWKSMKNSEENS
jgi:hypothetical protein